MDAGREYAEALADGDPETVADAMDRLGVRRHDPVGSWPSDRLGELVERRPDLLPEILRRRREDLVQL